MIQKKKKKKMKNNQLFFYFLMLIFFFFAYRIILFSHHLVKKEKLECKCHFKQRILHKFPSFLSSYYLKDELELMKSNEKRRLDYCKNRTIRFNLQQEINLILNSTQQIFIATMFHNNEEIIPYWFSEFQKLMDILKPLKPFVSILESHSSDLSPFFTHFIAEYLKSNGIEHSIEYLNNFAPYHLHLLFFFF